MDDRNARGQFVAGNSGAARKSGREYADAIRERVPIEKWHKIIDRAARDAEKGDATARAFLADRLIGKPPQILDITGGDASLLRTLLDEMRARGISLSAFVESALESIADDAEEGAEDES